MTTQDTISGLNLPSFHHPEIAQLFNYGFGIPGEIITQILSLPKVTMIQDLEAVLSFAESVYAKDPEFEFDFSTHSFPFHAVMLLGYLDDDEALEVILKHFSNGNGNEMLDCWYSDWYTEDFWIPLYHLGRTRLERLKSFVLDANITDPFIRDVASSAALQVALHELGRREEVIQWYKEVCEQLILRQSNPSEADATLFSFAVTEISDLDAKELLPLIQPAFDSDLYDPSVAGDWEEYIKEFDSSRRYAKKEIYPNILDWYAKAYKIELKIESRDDNIANYEFKEPYKYGQLDKNIENYFVNKATTFISSAPKVGRNDPCPCGSGKKYKKCCGA